MWSLVPPKLGSKTLVLFPELLICLLELFILLPKFINAIFEMSDRLKQLLHLLVSDHHNTPQPVQTTQDGLPAGDRLSENALSSALLYRRIKSNLPESGEIVLGVNTYTRSNEGRDLRVLRVDTRAESRQADSARLG